MKDWVDAIAKETYRWPQHIIAYTVPAAAHLRENGGEMTKEGLLSVLEQGQAYYTGRTEGLDDDHIVRLVEMSRDTPMEGGFQKQDLVAELGEPGFEQAVSKGILYHSNPLYTLPIPSLYDCLTERASRIREATLRYERVKKQRQQVATSQEMFPGNSRSRKTSLGRNVPKRKRETILQTVPPPKKRREENSRYSNRRKAILVRNLLRTETLPTVIGTQTWGWRGNLSCGFCWINPNSVR